LVIIDMVMPRMDGEECFLKLKNINPCLKAILSTGYSLNGKAQELIDKGMRGFVQKPYRVAELSQLLAKLLAQENAS